nr:retrotransposon protein, putative, unclassified [Tanacetum cinerariifolium]
MYLKNLKMPRQVTCGPPVGLKPTSDFVYRPVQPTSKTSGKKNSASTSGNKKQVDLSRQEVSNSNPFDALNSNPFDALNSVENDDDLVPSGCLNTTPLAEMVNKIERQMLDGNLMIVDDDWKPLNKFDSDPVNSNSASDVKVAYGETAQFMASGGANDASLYEDEDYDTYDTYDIEVTSIVSFALLPFNPTRAILFFWPIMLPAAVVQAQQAHVPMVQQRSLYGLKQAPRAWFQRFASFVTRISFQHSKTDTSLFIFQRGSDIAYLLLYVDDIILTTSSTALLQRIIALLHIEFAMTDLGSFSYFLGISAQQSVSGMFLSQSKFVEEIIERANMQNCNPCRTPVITESKLGSDGDPVKDPTLSRSLAGALKYLTFSRPDLSYTVQQLTAYTDVDWAGCPVTRWSTSRYCVFLGDNLLSCSAKRQVTLSRSSTEAEYRGVANVVAETAWIRNLLRELHTPLFTATLVYCDNVSVVYMSTNPVQHQLMKHIEIDIHFVREYVASSSLVAQRVKPSPSTPNPVRIIPGPASIVQQTKLLKEKVFILDSNEVLMSTQEYMHKVVEDVGEDGDFKSGSWVSATNYVNAFGGTVTGCLGVIENFLKNEKLDQVVAIVKSCSPNVFDDITVTMKDL